MSALSDVAVVSSAATNARNVPRVDVQRMTADGRRQAAAAGRLAREPRVKRPLNEAERRHVLDGHSPNSGKHVDEGAEDKTLFPAHWSDERIIDSIEDIINDDDTKWYAETGNGGTLTRAGRPTKWRAWEYRDGVRIRVVWEPATGVVRTGFPDPSSVENGVPIQ